MKANDVTDKLEMALDASGLGKATVLQPPRLLSDNGSSYISDDLAKWLERHDMAQVRGRPSDSRSGQTGAHGCSALRPPDQRPMMLRQ
jgi:transposase InsO family protein